MTCSNVMKFLKALQGEVSTLRRALPMSEEVHAMREVVNSMQGTGSDGTDCYPATAHLLHFDNLIFDM
eukprot:symbB.v1.2.039134.t1/scaffold6363.1/size21465/2